MLRYLVKTIFLTTTLGAVLATGINAQSTSQDFPTPIVSNEISGTIKPRDLGDSRLTTYYYALNGDQGDLFINIVTRNFAGDIDVFTANGLRPMTKIVVFADSAEAETGRAIYLRKSEKLLLRVQGRTPNDDDATFKLKFAGSFVAARPEDVPAAPELPKVSAENRGGIRVNSVGTILPAPPKPEPIVEQAKTETEAVAKTEKPEEPKPSEAEKPGDLEAAKLDLEVVVSDPIKAEKPPARRRTAASRRRSPARKAPVKKEIETPAAETTAEVETPAAENPTAKTTPSFRTLVDNRRAKAPKTPVAAKPDPLESINLVVQFKDGTTLEKKMSDVFKFSVDKGVLTVILKDRSVSRYPIVDVAKVTIE